MNTQPKITVVVPALNEEKVLGDCLEALAQQNYPKDAFDIIVVDNGSVDATAEIARDHGAKLLIEPRRSAYIARNRAIICSSGEYLAFTDADCKPDRDWLSSFATAAHDRRELIASGLTIYDVVVENIANKLLAENRRPEILRSYVLDHQCVAAGNMFVSRSLFCKYGLFRLYRSGADTDFSRRLAQHGSIPLLVETAIVRHRCDLSNLEHLKRSYGERRGQALLQSAQPTFVRLCHAVGDLPWRPGVSHLESGAAEWAYRWLDRWYGYAGRIHGEYLAWRGEAYPIPKYVAFD